MLLGDIEEGLVNILGHALGIATHIKIGTGVDPRPEFLSMLAHAVLHVDFISLVARESGVDAGQDAVADKRVEFVLVEKVESAALLAEDQPVFAFGLVFGTLLNEGAEG